MQAAIPITSAEDLSAHLRSLGVRTGDHLTVHSRLLSFGQIEGGVATVFDVLMDAVGKQGTVVAPSYTLSRETVYDLRSTPSEGVGALPEYMRTLPAVIRSACTMHNHVGLGSRVDVLKVSDGKASFGTGSDFEAFLDAGFRLLLLGLSMNEGATFIHHIEALAQVPYREWMELPRQYVAPDGEVRVTTCHYYGRPKHLVVEENFDSLEPVLLEAGLMTRVDTHFGGSRLVGLRELFEYGTVALQRDPYSLVKVG
jgi:aminoglycoside 3-N-acetyltransferase